MWIKHNKVLISWSRAHILQILVGFRDHLGNTSSITINYCQENISPAVERIIDIVLLLLLLLLLFSGYLCYTIIYLAKQIMRKIFAWVLDLTNSLVICFLLCSSVAMVYDCSCEEPVFQWNWCTVEASTKTGKYLDACNLLFEQGLLSHHQVNNKDSSVLEQWCSNHEDTGNLLAECNVPEKF